MNIYSALTAPSSISLASGLRFGGVFETCSSYLSPEERVRKDHPLRPIPAMVDEVLKQLSRRFDAMYAKVGRPSIPPESGNESTNASAG
jgi:hypothetical protein